MAIKKKISQLDPYGSNDETKNVKDLYEVSKNIGTVGTPIYVSAKQELSELQRNLKLRLVNNTTFHTDSATLVADSFNVFTCSDTASSYTFAAPTDASYNNKPIIFQVNVPTGDENDLLDISITDVRKGSSSINGYETITITNVSQTLFLYCFNSDWRLISISNQIPDLSTYLEKNTPIAPATKTKIAYDANGLILGGYDADIEDILETTNYKWYSAVDKAKVADLSGVNSGDNAVNTTSNAYADSLVVGLLDDRGNYNPSTNSNQYPTTGGSGTSGAIKKGDLWSINGLGSGVSASIGGKTVTDGDVIRALIDTPSQTDSNWNITENNFGYVAENLNNKTNTVTGNETSTTLYASVKGLVDWVSSLYQTLANKDATGGYVGLTLFKINFKNISNTFTSFFTNSNTASRTYTFQDRNGTIADDTDVTNLYTIETWSTNANYTVSSTTAKILIINQTGTLTTTRTLTLGTLPTGTIVLVCAGLSVTSVINIDVVGTFNNGGSSDILIKIANSATQFNSRGGGAYNSIAPVFGGTLSTDYLTYWNGSNLVTTPFYFDHSATPTVLQMNSNGRIQMISSASDSNYSVYVGKSVSGYDYDCQIINSYSSGLKQITNQAAAGDSALTHGYGDYLDNRTSGNYVKRIDVTDKTSTERDNNTGVNNGTELRNRFGSAFSGTPPNNYGLGDYFSIKPSSDNTFDATGGAFFRLLDNSAKKYGFIWYINSVKKFTIHESKGVQIGIPTATDSALSVQSTTQGSRPFSEYTYTAMNALTSINNGCQVSVVEATNKDGIYIYNSTYSLWLSANYIMNQYVMSFPRNIGFAAQTPVANTIYGETIRIEKDIIVTKMGCYTVASNGSETWYLDIYDMSGNRLTGGTLTPSTQNDEVFCTVAFVRLVAQTEYKLTLRSNGTNASFAKKDGFSTSSTRLSWTATGVTGSSPSTLPTVTNSVIQPFISLETA